MFFGEHLHSLDVKGRLILPARFRDAFARGAYLTPIPDGCLGVFTPEEFDQITTVFLERARQGLPQRSAMRTWASRATDVTLDKQGRVFIPANLRGYAHLETDVVVTGAINHVELWNPQKWAEVSEQGAAGLSSGDDAFADMGF